MSKIYLAYRHADAHPDVPHVIEGLARVHGAAALIEGVPVNAGSDVYRTLVANAVRESTGVVLIAGPEFNTAPDALGRRRLDNPDDPLRIELEAALRLKGMMVVVALVGGYLLPDAAELPRSLRPLTRRGIVNMGAVESFDRDQHYLNEAVRKMLDGSARKAVRNVILVFIAIMLASILFMVAATIAANAPR